MGIFCFIICTCHFFVLFIFSSNFVCAVFFSFSQRKSNFVKGPTISLSNSIYHLLIIYYVLVIFQSFSRYSLQTPSDDSLAQNRKLVSRGQISAQLGTIRVCLVWNSQLWMALPESELCVGTLRRFLTCCRPRTFWIHPLVYSQCLLTKDSLFLSVCLFQDIYVCKSTRSHLSSHPGYVCRSDCSEMVVWKWVIWQYYF